MWWPVRSLAPAMAVVAVILPPTPLVVLAEEKLPPQVVLEQESQQSLNAGNSTTSAQKQERRAAADSTAKHSKLTLPIPVGHEVKGIRVPYFDVYGAKQLDFYADQARRTDEDVIRMTDAEIEFFDEQGGREMKVFLPSGVFNLSTQVLGSDQPARIERRDFIVTGNKLVFHLPDKRGRLMGNVRMYVFDKEKLGASVKKP